MFPVISHPQIIEEGTKPFQALFSKEAFEHFKRYLTGLVVSQNKTIEGINQIFLERFDQSTLNRFLTQMNWSEKTLNDRRVEWLESDPQTRTRAKNSILSIDDTLTEKYGRKMPEADWYYSPKQGRKYQFGHSLVTSQYTDKDKSFAVDLELYRKYPQKRRLQELAGRINWQDKRELIFYLKKLLKFHQRVKEFEIQRFKTKHELFRELITDATERKLLFEAAAFDSWFFNRENVGHIESFDRNWITQAKSNVVVIYEARRTHLKDWAKGLAQKNRGEFEKITIKTKTQTKNYYCYTKNLKVSMLDKKCRIVVSFDNPYFFGDPKFIVTNNLSWQTRKILDLYSLRWGSETFYRESKLHLGLEDYQLRSLKGTKRHWYLVFLADTLLGSACRTSALGKLVQGRSRTIGENCRQTSNEILKALICWLFQQIPLYTSPEAVYQVLFI